MSTSRPRRRDAGQSPVMAVLVLAALALVAAVFVTGKIAVASSEKGQARHGADAAALAGAQAVLDEIPADVAPGFLTPADVPLLLGGGRCVQTGHAQAQRLAQANGVTLTSYCYDAYRDEVEVTARGDDGARAEATAATTFDAGTCRLDPGFTPPSEPADSDPDPGEPGDDSTPPPVQRTTIDCGIAGLVVTFDPADSRFHFVGLGLVLADVRPRLTR